MTAPGGDKTDEPGGLKADQSTDAGRLKRAALMYAEMRWPVFPCEPRDKAPLAGLSPTDATTDPQQIEEWWDATPDANIGIATGPSSEGARGLWAIDIDPEARPEFEKMLGGSELPATPFETTGAAGKTIYVFAWTPNVAIRGIRGADGGQMPAGVNVCGAGGWFVAAPSVHARGRRYAWDDAGKPTKVAVAEAPRKLLAQVVAVRKASGPTVVDKPLVEVTPPTRRAGKPVLVHNASAVGQGAAARKVEPEPDEKPKKYLEWMKNDTYAVTDKNGGLKPRKFVNCVAIMENSKEFKDLFQYDSFAQRIFVTRRPLWARTGWEPGEMGERDVAGARMVLEKMEMDIRKSDVVDAIKFAADARMVNPVKDWMEAQVWDGVPRLNHWLVEHCGARADEISTTVVGAKWMISAVARVYKPGAKVDTMLILEGRQGLRKSMAFDILGTLGGVSYFSDNISKLGSKDSRQELAGKLIVEFAEMSALKQIGAGDAKGFLSTRIDTYRPPYGDRSRDYPRQCVFCGTVNPDGVGYLPQDTENRRYWIVSVKKIDITGLTRDRDQLWAEAIARYKAGEEWWLDDAAAIEVEKEAQRRSDADVWTDRITEIVTIMGKPKSPVFIPKLLKEMGMEDRAQETGHHMRIARVLHALGYKSDNNILGDHGRRCRGWLYVGKDGEFY